jgi:branched-chain amino acid transport system permease protein
MGYALHLFILIEIFGILAISLDILVGHTGLISIAHAAFFGIGAYSAALLALNFGVSFPACAIFAMLLAVVLSLLVSLPSLKFRGDYFVLMTFAFQVIAYDIFNNWIEVTKGPLGLPGIPAPGFLGWQVSSEIGFACLSTILAAIAFLAAYLLISAPFGRVLHAIREDEFFALATGHNATKFKVYATAVSAVLASLAGVLYAYYITYIDPTSFTVTQSILILAMVIVGGAGSRFGPIVGAAILVLLPELLRFVGFNDNIAAHLHEIIYGALITILMMFRPQGILGNYRFK